MKQFLHLRKLLCSMLIIVFALSTITAQEIIFVYNPGVIDATTGVSPELPTITLLEEAGYTVHPFTTFVLADATQEQLDSLGSADLIYIGRAVGSANFQSPSKELWHAISTPVMTGNMWGLRNNRMNWFNTDGCSNIDDPLDAVFTGEIWGDDQVFEGLTGAIDWWTGPYSTINVTDAGNGQVLATKSASGSTTDNQVIFARFESYSEFYEGSVDMPSGPRTYLGSASDNMLNADAQKIYNYLGFTEQTNKIFLNEVAIMTGVYVPPVGIKQKQNPKLSVFPVPANDHLMVEMDNLKKVDVMDISGKYVASYTANSKKLSMDVSNLRSGIYFLKISNNNGDTRIRKITKN